MFEEGTNPSDVLVVVRHGTVIRYPEGRPFPSVLILGFVRETPAHVVAALDSESGCLSHRDRLHPRSGKMGARFPNQESGMTCLICKTGATQSGSATVTLERDSTTVVLKEVPADICDNCGEYYLDSAMTTRVLELAREAASRHSEVEIVRFAA